MLNKIKKDNKGFTIIEVLIVLAIAGLIMLVVFLAVPALQRSSRNSQLRSAVSAVAGGANEFIANNNGKLPTSVTITTGVATISGVTSTTPVTVKVSGSLETADITYKGPSFKCDGTVAIAGTARQFALTFEVETGGTNAPQCVDG